ncbi:MAG TPA: sigma factor-like helix-turn-helix DNA-binding protein [Patescibacteria group bacterium]|jgi:DNA-directed RNA polymerase delta subunit|nr:sigma factor-like helix-turn-helix DNA-binding protein [Patescibacteria group bacterium]
MDETAQTNTIDAINAAIKDALSAIDQEREREIISRRFGLFDRKETLEQIGEMLGITRERVRQLEKAILIRLKIATEEGKITSTADVERAIIRDLAENGRVGRVHDITQRLVGSDKTAEHKAHVAFLAELSPKLTVVNENDMYHHAVGIAEYGNEKDIKKKVDALVKIIKQHGEPIHIDELHAKTDYEHPTHVSGLASVSKLLATLNGYWGLTKWPTVNPKNIRDKIYVILSENGSPMHFSAIASAIKESDFKRKNVTTQAIHNELIKDSRFVLIGRGIYALDAWGYSKGTVSDIIRSVLTEAGEPLHRDDIVRRVLKKRQVKETTILLNLQSKPEFKRVAKATYALAEK